MNAKTDSSDIMRVLIFSLDTAEVDWFVVIAADAYVYKIAIDTVSNTIKSNVSRL